ncbi:hypothetical protein SOCE26_021880 [Sorangium cellulosum]|uniref:Secreted protein n=1 Tax=Sorangium cellulosum TaxID=56 RepID=A0A2L0ENB6_SORCE|nr:hypothetical protein [Sorangium cellulosum]AUX40787.1 hypothetical protein SOCE26_021880 [Sorangium cellulosum]
MRDQRAMLPALLVSALVHLGAWRSASLSAQEPARGPVPEPEEREPIDLWTGATAALPGSGSAARSADARAGSDGPGAASSPAEVAPPEAAQPEPAQPRAPAARDAKAGSARAQPRAAAARREAAQRPAAAPRPREERRAPAAAANAGRQARSAAAPASDDAGEGGQGDFGAAGASAVRSLGRAFTRAIPPACQADPVWATLPLGTAGKARFVIDIDDAGHIASWRPEGEEPPARHLGNLAKRTIALLGSGTFAVSRGAVTSGRQTLEVSAVIRAGADEPADAPADLAWRFEGGRGKASFAQPGGRQVDVVVQVVRTEVARTAPPG